MRGRRCAAPKDDVATPGPDGGDTTAGANVDDVASALGAPRFLR
jgi:hypothetical protein